MDTDFIMDEQPKPTVNPDEQNLLLKHIQKQVQRNRLQSPGLPKRVLNPRNRAFLHDSAFDETTAYDYSAQKELVLDSVQLGFIKRKQKSISPSFRSTKRQFRRQLGATDPQGARGAQGVKARSSDCIKVMDGLDYQSLQKQVCKTKQQCEIDIFEENLLAPSKNDDEETYKFRALVSRFDQLRAESFLKDNFEDFKSIMTEFDGIKVAKSKEWARFKYVLLKLSRVYQIYDTVQERYAKSRTDDFSVKECLEAYSLQEKAQIVTKGYFLLIRHNWKLSYHRNRQSKIPVLTCRICYKKYYADLAERHSTFCIEKVKLLKLHSEKDFQLLSLSTDATKKMLEISKSQENSQEPQKTFNTPTLSRRTLNQVPQKGSSTPNLRSQSSQNVAQAVSGAARQTGLLANEQDKRAQFLKNLATPSTQKSTQNSNSYFQKFTTVRKDAKWREQLNYLRTLKLQDCPYFLQLNIRDPKLPKLQKYQKPQERLLEEVVEPLLLDEALPRLLNRRLLQMQKRGQVKTQPKSQLNKPPSSPLLQTRSQATTTQFSSASSHQNQSIQIEQQNTVSRQLDQLEKLKQMCSDLYTLVSTDRDTLHFYTQQRTLIEEMLTKVSQMRSSLELAQQFQALLTQKHQTIQTVLANEVLYQSTLPQVLTAQETQRRQHDQKLQRILVGLGGRRGKRMGSQEVGLKGSQLVKRNPQWKAGDDQFNLSSSSSDSRDSVRVQVYQPQANSLNEDLKRRKPKAVSSQFSSDFANQSLLDEDQIAATPQFEAVLPRVHQSKPRFQPILEECDLGSISSSGSHREPEKFEFDVDLPYFKRSRSYDQAFQPADRDHGSNRKKKDEEVKSFLSDFRELLHCQRDDYSLNSRKSEEPLKLQDVKFNSCVILPSHNRSCALEEHQQTAQRVTAKDFTFLKILSGGAYGKVALARKTDTKDIFAIKIMDKQRMADKKMTQFIMTERDVLQKIDCDYIVRGIWAFQSSKYLYMVMEYMRGGDFSTYLDQQQYLNVPQAKYYLAFVVKGLEYLHSKGMVHRDIKPENMLISQEGYLKLTDFGLSGEEEKKKSEDSRIVGTPDYMAPESLMNKKVSVSMDFWSFGVLAYEVLTGNLPFNDETQQAVFENILNKEIEFPDEPLDGEIKDEARDLLRKLLVRDPRKRLGSKKGVQELKEHPFFAETNWDGLLKEIPPWRPPPQKDIEVRNFPNSREHDADFKKFLLEEGLSGGDQLKPSTPRINCREFSKFDNTSFNFLKHINQRESEKAQKWAANKLKQQGIKQEADIEDEKLIQKHRRCGENE